MKKFLRLFYDHRIDSETRYGAIFGVVAIIAVIIEVVLSGFSVEGIVAGIKDAAGTMVALAVFCVAASALLPKAQVMTFEEKLTAALNTWIDAHSNMIVRTSKMRKGHEHDFGMSMTTDINRFYNTEKLKNDSGSGVGRFLRISQIDKEIYMQNKVQLDFYINAQTYCSADSSPEATLKELLEVGTRLSSYIVGAVNGINNGEPYKEGDRTVIIPISFEKPIVSADDDNIDLLINTIDRMYEAMLVSARRK